MFNTLSENNFLRLMRYMKGRWVPYIIGLIGTSFANISISIIAAFVLKSLIDSAIDNNALKLFRSLLLIFFILILICIISPFTNYLLNMSVRKTVGDIRSKAFSKLCNLPIIYYENHHSGDITSRTTNDIQSIENAYTDQISNVIQYIIRGIVSGIIMLNLNIYIGLIVVLFGIISVYINKRFSQPVREISRRIQNKLATYTESLSNLISGVQLIKIYNITSFIIGRYDKENQEVRNLSIKRTLKNSWVGGTNELVRYMSFAGILSISCFFVYNRITDLGSVIAILQLQEGVTMMFNYLGRAIVQLQGSLAAFSRITELLDEKEEINDCNCMHESFKSNEMIEFKDVCFSYTEGHILLKKINFSLGKGRIGAIVGPSGIGKSTILKLILGFYSPYSGDIFIDGKRISCYTPEQLRNYSSYVSQDTFLFSGTIAENISYGKPGATFEEIVDAAKKANAHEFIIKSPEGYNTVVGERGSKLSGGQKQRIAIARAILKDAPILLLDEPTSSLDSESEALVQEALDRFMKGRTTLVISHRLSTIKNSDIIFVINDGEVKETGTDDQLQSINGIYKHFYDFQFFKQDTLNA